MQKRKLKQEQSLFGISQWNEENWKMIKVNTDEPLLYLEQPPAGTGE